jgi:hypothetical protein
MLNVFESIKASRISMMTRLEKLEDLVFEEKEKHDCKFDQLETTKNEFMADVKHTKIELLDRFDKNLSEINQTFIETNAKYEEKNHDTFDMYMENLRTAQVHRTAYKIELDEIITRNTGNIQKMLDNEKKFRAHNATL